MCIQNRQSGFTMVEVAVSMMVVGIGFVSLLAVFTTGVRWASEISDDSVMAYNAEHIVNKITSLNAGWTTYKTQGYWEPAAEDTGGSPAIARIYTDAEPYRVIVKFFDSEDELAKERAADGDGSPTYEYQSIFFHNP